MAEAGPYIYPSVTQQEPGIPQRGGDGNVAAWNNLAACCNGCIFFCCCCCCCVMFVLPVFAILAFLPARSRLMEWLAPEQYEFAEWATVSDVRECSSVVRDVFSRNGNLGDAAVSALLCMGVAAPHLMGLGGGFLALYYDERRDKVEALNALGISPADVTNVDENAVKRGAKASIVPGALRGYKELHERLRGRMKWEDLFGPAIKLAKEGFPIKKHFAKVLAKHATELSITDIKKIFDGVSKEGDKLVQLDLAKLLEDISKKGADHFYTEVCEEIVNGLGADAVLTKDDFKNYKPTWSQPVTEEYSGYTFYTLPFPSSGVLLFPVIPWASLLLSHKLKQNEDEGSEASAQGIDLPLTPSLEQILSSVLAKLPDLDGDAPDKGFPELVREIEDSIAHRQPARNSQHKIVPDYGGVHLSIIKGYEAVTIISGINEPFGSKKASVPGLIMNNYMSVFATTPDVPNGIKGGKQPRTSMVAVFAKKSGQRVLRFQAGAGGGLPGMWALVEATASGIFAKKPLVSWLAPNDNVHCDGTSDGEKTTALKKYNAVESTDYCKRTKECQLIWELLDEMRSKKSKKK
ncbi:scoloptoxin SSD14-like isoform X2 [Dermacentor albipictus]|uniref:scoloptoxin SSD14-like isoform X2 n=1 Tax=Dermacentor albipictus TaxID=60249 RepID=UPI0031FC6194